MKYMYVIMCSLPKLKKNPAQLDATEKCTSLRIILQKRCLFLLNNCLDQDFLIKIIIMFTLFVQSTIFIHT